MGSQNDLMRYGTKAAMETLKKKRICLKEALGEQKFLLIDARHTSNRRCLSCSCLTKNQRFGTAPSQRFEKHLISAFLPQDSKPYWDLIRFGIAPSHCIQFSKDYYLIGGRIGYSVRPCMA